MRFAISHRLSDTAQIDFAGQFQPGERIALLGRSGAGKTTFLRYLAGLNKAGQCHVSVGEQRLRNPWTSQATLLHQHPVMFAHHRVEQTIDYGQKYLLSNRSLSSLPVLPMNNWIEQLGVEPLLFQPCRQLSGGQAQRVALLRALNTRRPWLLLDEAFSALDAPRVLAACQVIAEYCQLTGAGIVVASHQDTPQRFLCDSAYLVDELRGTYHKDLFVVLDQQLNPHHLSTLNVLVSGEKHGFLSTVIDGQVLYLPTPEQWESRPARVSIAASEVAVAVGDEHLTSMVNRLKTQVLAIDEDDKSKVTLTLGIGDQSLAVEISPWSFQRLNLSLGKTVFAEFKVGAVQWHGQAFSG